MSADNMPPLPEGVEHIAGTNRHFAKVCGTVTAYTADQMHAYARAYAAEQTRELVEALQSAVDAWSGGGPPVVLDTLRALIAKHKGVA